MKRVFSGIQPTGNLTLGNYLGALKRFVDIQNEHDCYYCIVDLHALTVMPEPSLLHKGTLDAAAIFLAAGVDPNKANLFIQSHVTEHSELAWLLQCLSYYGELSRMTQFKDKKQQIENKKKGNNSVTAGLFTYPALMAADILLYDTDIVPVGQDQKQHVELARNIAIRANNIIQEGVFVVPEPVIPKVGGKIMSLREPTKKMSKSDPIEAAKILLLDSPDVIIKKFKKAKTDSDNIISYDPENKAGVSNLLEIQSICSGKSIEQIVEELADEGYGRLKISTAESVIALLEPIQKRFYALRESSDLMKYLKQGAENASKVAKQTLTRYQKAIGLVQ
ncbi:tryptophan--tRNA ligase [Clostridium sp. 'deep sea']|uniref:tryptophan--tRNA ligase n=1 Tax=Clostridium sp. 'deep sea' TaxID=2779445 RepID=UPI0018968A66|nr:tryptophan--tRNA ligase [Clostridium sp. 'deep sea']QOR35918.1 tryptophan--tRNA ligase [Clostridium sp. 'deep sea']